MKQQILIVEDEIFVAMELEYGLTQQGYDVVGIAPDKASAMALAEQGIDIAFVDLNLRDGPTGREIGKALAEDGVMVIFITANPTLLGAGVEGTVGVLSKPCSEATIAAALAYATTPVGHKPPPEMRVFAGT
jgi:DNA-binding response OmpR family regulator